MNATSDTYSIWYPPTSPTDQATKKILDDNVDVMIDCLANLQSRWADEKEFENIADYMKVIVEKLKLQITNADDVKAGKWSVSFKLPNNRWYSYYLKKGIGGWKRIK